MKYLKRIVYVILTISLVIGACIFYAIKIEPYRLIVDTYAMDTKDFVEKLSIIQISDIQISESYSEKELEKLVDKINQLKPDVILFTGDLYENYAEYGPADSIVALLSQMQATYGKYAIYGNRDYGGGASRIYEEVMNQSGFSVLINDGIHITLENQETIFIGGLDDSLLSAPNIDLVVEKMKEQKTNYAILLTHEPDIIDEYANYDFDLVLAGHSHGGQVKLPFIGGIVTSLAEKYIDGFYTISDTMQLYVNTGIGTSRYPIRFLVPPEITEFVFNDK